MESWQMLLLLLYSMAAANEMAEMTRGHAHYPQAQPIRTSETYRLLGNGSNKMKLLLSSGRGESDRQHGDC
ncbi:hypothetical protein chiPu_0010110 [Chiloscyllium punctatum]|uniref:Uncharacterized protein n=1 Tax=Chiloscyllium punctatum TaxID=137246 RepID=A0A401SMP0_CHIPU|nr:hypothetical protein [Chiloscyllium punctatum]